MRSTKTVVIAILAVLMMLSCGEMSAQNRKKEKFYDSKPVVDSPEYALASGGVVEQESKAKIDWDLVDLDTLTLFPKHIRPEVYPKYKYGDMREFRDKVARNLTLPKSLIAEMRDTGEWNLRIFVIFIVEKDGSVKEVRCERRQGPEHNVDVIKHFQDIVTSNNQWIPGSHKGRVVRTEICLPIEFRR